MKPFTAKATYGTNDDKDWRIVDLLTAADAAQAELIMTSRRASGRYPFVSSDKQFKVEPMSLMEQSRLERYARAIKLPGRLPSSDNEIASFITQRALLIRSWCTACYVNPTLLEEERIDATEEDIATVETDDDSSGGSERIPGEPEAQQGTVDPFAEMDNVSSTTPTRGTDFDSFIP